MYNGVIKVIWLRTSCQLGWSSKYMGSTSQMQQEMGSSWRFCEWKKQAIKPTIIVIVIVIVIVIIIIIIIIRPLRRSWSSSSLHHPQLPISTILSSTDLKIRTWSSIRKIEKENYSKIVAATTYIYLIHPKTSFISPLYMYIGGSEPTCFLSSSVSRHVFFVVLLLLARRTNRLDGCILDGAAAVAARFGPGWLVVVWVVDVHTPFFNQYQPGMNTN